MMALIIRLAKTLLANKIQIQPKNTAIIKVDSAISNPIQSSPRSSWGDETPGETPGIDFECKCGQSIDKVCTHIFWLNSRRPYCLQKPWKEGDK